MHVIWNTVQHGQFTHQIEKEYTISMVEVFSDLAYELCYCVDNAVNNIPEKPGNLVQWHCDFFLGVSNDWESSSTHISVLIVGFVCGLDMGWVKITSVGLHYAPIFYRNMSLQLIIVYFVINIFIQIFMTIWMIWSILEMISGAFRSILVLCTKFVCSTNSVGHGWWIMIFCFRFQNDEVKNIW